MRKALQTALALLATVLATAAHAAFVAQSTSTNGTLLYNGMGDVGGGVGSGRYTLGNCTFAGGATTCSLTGNYVETVESTHAPGQGGSFELDMSYPGSGLSPVIAHSAAPGDDSLQFTTTGDAVFTLTVSPAGGGTVSGVYPAAVFADSIAFSAFLDPSSLTCTGLAAGQVCGAGQVGLVAGSSATGSVKPLQFSIPLPGPPANTNFEGLWWNSPAGSEAGWGINLAHQGDTIFATWFTYDLDGKAWWLSMTANKVSDGVYSGTLYQTNGPAFNAQPFVPGQVTLTAVGSATLAFTNAALANFSYTIGSASQTKQITRQVFSTLPVCVWGSQSDLTKAVNFQDLWWAAPAASESGWGINFTQQGTTIFATWFTYDGNRNPLWYSITAPQTSPNVFSGSLQRTSGPPFDAVPFDLAQVRNTPVGNATFTFSNGNAGTFAYQVNDGINQGSQTKSIVRQVFNPPGTVCQ